MKRLLLFDPSPQAATSRVPQDAGNSGFAGIASWVRSTAPSGQESVEHRVGVIVRHSCALLAHIAEKRITYLLYPRPLKMRMTNA
ncbi:hypothetical protein LDHU3_31.0720:CDS1 [Leishmania donovani]|uniref:Hypothetical_protein n=2 Tax=Leishmania donovani species complex TaxID=38574 RepID=A0A6L0XMP0_LEIIN|nr:hypothetical protein LdCL_310010400 [Leishmania donovani]CAC9517740.1 hypothetical_protein [Leishmania infantum]CAJ1991231.1 hypothetical protein LDHU3_31.0720:CDS1 [Leishmania donovani]SUZ44252.1 hypothetical_protein [Leishmania infantum]VDZ47077.1 hypothetical_protein [Leishmania donovani]